MTRWGKTREQYAAHRAVEAALKAGTLVAADACETCGATDRRLVPHHDDYAKPLGVRFLCGRCHSQHHFALRQVAASA